MMAQPDQSAVDADMAASFEEARAWAQRVSRIAPQLEPDDLLTPDIDGEKNGIDALFDEAQPTTDSEAVAEESTMTLPNKLAAKHSMAVRIEIAQLEAQLTEAETACAEAIQQRKGAVTEAAVIAKQKRALESEVARLKDQLNKSNEERTQENLARSAADDKSKELLSHIKQLQDDMQTLLAEKKTAAEELDAARATLAVTTARHQHSLEQMQREAVQKSADLAKKNAAAAEKELVAMKKELAAAWDARLAENVQTVTATWEKKHKLLLADYAGLEPRYKSIREDLQTQLAGYEFDLTMLKASHEKLTSDHTDEKAKHKQARKSLKKVRAELIDVKAKLEESKRTVGDLERSVAARDENIADLQKQTVASDQRSQVLSSQLTEVTSQHETLTMQATSLRKDLDTAHAANARVEADLRAAAEAHGATRRDLDATHEALAAEQALVTRVRNEGERKDRALKDMETTLSDTMAHVEEQRADLEAARAEAASLAAIAASGALTLQQLAGSVDTATSSILAGVDVLAAVAPSTPHRASVVRRVSVPCAQGLDCGLLLMRDPLGSKLGVRVKDIVPKSPAAKTDGVCVGDVVLSVNGVAMHNATVSELVHALENATGSNTSTIALEFTSGEEFDNNDSAFWRNDSATENGASNAAKSSVESSGGDPSVETTSAAPDECVGENASSVGDGVVDAAALAMENQSAAATAATQRLVAVVGTSSTGITAARQRAEMLCSTLQLSRRRASALAMDLARVTTDVEDTSAALAASVLEADANAVKADEATHAHTESIKEVAALTHTLNENSIRIRSLEIEVESVRALCDATQLAKADADAQIELLQEDLQASKYTRSELSAKIAMYEAEIARARGDIENQEKKISALEAQCSEITFSRDETETAEGAMRSELVSVAAQLDEALERACHVAKLHEEADRRATALAAELATTTAAKATLESAHATLEADLDVLQQDHARLQEALSAEVLEREHLEAGLGEAISALAAASDAHAMVSVLEDRIKQLESTGTDHSTSMTDTRVELELCKSALATEKENTAFAKDVLSQAGADKATLQAELEACYEEISNLKELLRAAEDQQFAVDASNRTTGDDATQLRAKCKDYQAMLSNERTRIGDLETLLATSMNLRDDLEQVVQAQHIRLAALDPAHAAAERNAEDLIARSARVSARVLEADATSNIIKAFTTFGVVTRHVVLRKPVAGRWGLEVCHDSDLPYDGVVVSGVRDGSVAAESKGIHVGDLLVCVNGKFVLDATYDTVLAMIAATDGALSLVLGAPDQMLDE